MLSEKRKAELLEMQHAAKELQQQYPDRSLIMYGIPTVKAEEYFPEAPKDQVAQLKTGIYLEDDDEHKVVEPFDAAKHGGLFDVKKFKIFLQGA